MNKKTFGEFVAQRRKEKSITLRGFASDLGIAPSYLSDIEKGRKHPPDIKTLEKIAEILDLSKERREVLFNLAGKERNNIPPDLPNYIMENKGAVRALRAARDTGMTADDWEQIIEFIYEK